MAMDVVDYEVKGGCHFDKLLGGLLGSVLGGDDSDA